METMLLLLTLLSMGLSVSLIVFVPTKEWFCFYTTITAILTLALSLTYLLYQLGVI